MKSLKHLKRFSKEWWQNVWFYYKWYMIIGVCLVALLANTIFYSFTRVEPDLHVLFGGDFALLDEDKRILTERLEDAITDVNNDGKTVARLHVISLSIDKEKFDETTAGSNQQLQTQFITGQQHIYVLDFVNFNRFYAQGLLDPDTLFELTKDNPLFEGTSLAQQDLIMITRVKRHDMESNFTTSQQIIDRFATPNTKERFQEYVKNHNEQ